jgi:hypothetical protein
VDRFPVLVALSVAARCAGEDTLHAIEAAELDDMEIDSEALRRLVAHCETKFVLAPSGRILRENDPDRSAGPRLFIAGCPLGNLAHIRHDVSDQTAERMLDLLAAESPWLKPAARPLRFREVMECD